MFSIGLISSTVPSTVAMYTSQHYRLHVDTNTVVQDPRPHIGHLENNNLVHLCCDYSPPPPLSNPHKRTGNLKCILEYLGLSKYSGPTVHVLLLSWSTCHQILWWMCGLVNILYTWVMYVWFCLLWTWSWTCKMCHIILNMIMNM
jgi:hypothetical protein